MGNKVSSKMAAPAARAIQVLRPHTPLIKFPIRQAIPKPNAQEVLKTLAVNLPHQGSPTTNPPAPLPSPSKHTQTVNRLPGSPDTMASIQLLPQRYRRRPLAAEEMEFIQRGGPE